MDRIKLIQEVIDLLDFNTYLEIGCHSGYSFLPIKCKNKIAIDPKFNISFKQKVKWALKNPYNLNNSFFEETSNDFFQNRTQFLNKQVIDVALVDGLHTFEASLTDVLNLLPYLNEDGIIVMHDCLPPHEAAALPTKHFPTLEQQQIEGWTGAWCGDVWKTIVYLKNQLKDFLDVFVFDFDFGLGIIRLKKQISTRPEIEVSVFNEIDQLTYKDLKRDTTNMLNLKASDYYDHFIRSIKN